MEQNGDFHAERAITIIVCISNFYLRTITVEKAKVQVLFRVLFCATTIQYLNRFLRPKLTYDSSAMSSTVCTAHRCNKICCKVWLYTTSLFVDFVLNSSHVQCFCLRTVCKIKVCTNFVTSMCRTVVKK